MSLDRTFDDAASRPAKPGVAGLAIGD